MNTTHPVTSGEPSKWLHPQDALHIWLKGPALGLTVLSYYRPEGEELGHPVEWTVDYGVGRVFNTTMGHFKEGEVYNSAHACAGFQTNFIRGAEWAATGQTSLPVPGDFPTESSTSIRSGLPDQ